MSDKAKVNSTFDALDRVLSDSQFLRDMEAVSPTFVPQPGVVPSRTPTSTDSSPTDSETGPLNTGFVQDPNIDASNCNVPLSSQRTHYLDLTPTTTTSVQATASSDDTESLHLTPSPMAIHLATPSSSASSSDDTKSLSSPICLNPPQ